jgi:hypothetical protein
MGCVGKSFWNSVTRPMVEHAADAPPRRTASLLQRHFGAVGSHRHAGRVLATLRSRHEKARTRRAKVALRREEEENAGYRSEFYCINFTERGRSSIMLGGASPHSGVTGGSLTSHTNRGPESETRMDKGLAGDSSRVQIPSASPKAIPAETFPALSGSGTQ